MRSLRLFPRSVGGQLLAFLLSALVVTQAISLLFFTDERGRAVRAAMGLEAAGRAANVARLLEEAPADLRPSILRSADSPLVRFRVEPQPAAPAIGNNGAQFIRQIRQVLGDSHQRDIRANIDIMDRGARGPFGAMTREMRPMHQAMVAQRTEPLELSISIELSDGNWLNVQSMFHRPALQWTAASVLPLLLMAGAIVLVVWVTSRRIVMPMNALARGADRLGRGMDVDPLSVTGPGEVRRTTEAFNRMQARLTRFVTDRTQMLAALGHDLRSPLTAMRLRLELLEDDENRERLTAMVDEMQMMVESTLDFARGMARSEASARISLDEFLVQLADEAKAGGGLVSVDIRQKQFASVRPTALKRALRNLVENALRYGGSADISLEERDGMAVVKIADNGPGLPEDQMMRVFDPFVRLEGSRSRDTGGVGLGLAIARTIIQAHGGEITLANRPEGGLVATVCLPPDAES